MPRRGNLGGHRVLIASLFLPDTVRFSEPELDSAFVESPEESTAPPSPQSAPVDPPLSVHELSSRLAASILDRQGGDLAPSAPPSETTPKPRQSSFNDKKINMSDLMYEASALPKLDFKATDGSVSNPPSPVDRSRKNSNNSDHRPVQTDIPVAPASDHGRAAQALSAAAFSTSPLTAPTLPLSSGQKSRRASLSGGVSGTALAPTIVQPEGSGTRTPGARAAGKVGITTPLSIISDLAAKSGGPVPQMPVAGDSERHHPFGSGAVTPIAGNKTPGHTNRPSVSSSRLIGGLHPSALTMSKASQAPVSLPPVLSKLSNSPLPPVTSRTQSAVASGSINDHGRGAPTHQHSSPLAKSPSFSRDALKTEARSAAMSPSSSRMGRSSAPSGFHRNRSTRSAHRNKHTRRTSSNGPSRSSVRRYSTASFDTILDEPSTLPPYEFITNPAANGGLVNAVRSIERDRLRAGKLYIGTCGIENQDWLGQAEKRYIEGRYRDERASVPVWVEADVFDLSYNQFCKQILWPTFHYTLPTSKGLELENDAFRAYWEVNHRFADAIADVYQEGDIVWINDYHLLLVPQMVRERLPHATIGLFVHIAFPSSELFRCLSVRETLLKGMLGADLVGFQTHNFCRHFNQTVSRILQLETTPKGVQLEGSFVQVSPFPIGIDVRNLNAKRREPEVFEWVTKLKEKYAGKRIIVGRDKLDWIKGLRQKLLGFEAFLDEHPEWAGEVVLIQVALATTEENEEIGEATDVVSRINKKYSSLTYQPVVFLHVQDITFCQYLALLTVADCFLATSLREGMNLTSHEYVVCQEVRHRPLVLSEFTGTYSGLRACIGINPWNTKQVAHAIYKALTMNESEMVQRWTDLHRVVVTQTAQQWIISLLGHLERAHLEQERLENMFVPRLEIAQLVSEWRAANSRLLLIDLEDTLIKYDPIQAHKEGGFKPPEWLLKLLHDLTQDPKNVVYILGGMSTDDLDQLSLAGDMVGLVAEDGCFVKHAGEGHWNSLVAPFDLCPVGEILSYFTERTPGSYIEQRRASMCWRFWSDKNGNRSSHEAQWARRQSSEVSNLIHERFSHSLRVVPCQTSCLILPRHASRTSAVQHIIMQMSVLGGVPLVSTMSHSNLSAMAPALPDQPHHPPLDNAYKQPSNHWPVPLSQSAGMSPTTVQSNIKLYPSLSSQSIHTGHTLGTFDFVLALGQDEKLLAYVNTLDLFAPVTCTTVDLNKNRGTEASYFLPQKDVKEAIEEMIGFRARDLKWANV